MDECSSIANEMATTAFFHYNYREQLVKFCHLLELKINVNQEKNQNDSLYMEILRIFSGLYQYSAEYILVDAKLIKEVQ